MASSRNEWEGGGLDNRVGGRGECCRTVGPRVKLAPSHSGGNSTTCLRSIQLRRLRRDPEHWFAGQGALRAASGPTGGWGPASGGGRHHDPVGSWSLGGPSAEAVTSGTRPLKEALERRTRRTHCERSCDNPGITSCCLPRSPHGFACV